MFQLTNTSTNDTFFKKFSEVYQNVLDIFEMCAKNES